MVFELDIPKLRIACIDRPKFLVVHIIRDLVFAGRKTAQLKVALPLGFFIGCVEGVVQRAVLLDGVCLGDVVAIGVQIFEEPGGSGDRYRDK